MFAIVVVNKTATSAAQLANCILLHAFIHVQGLLHAFIHVQAAAPSSELRELKLKLHIAYLTSWH